MHVCKHLFLSPSELVQAVAEKGKQKDAKQALRSRSRLKIEVAKAFDACTSLSVGILSSSVRRNTSVLCGIWCRPRSDKEPFERCGPEHSVHFAEC